MKITKQGKKKNDKDKIGNIMLKHVLKSLLLSSKKGGPPTGSDYAIW